MDKYSSIKKYPRTPHIEGSRIQAGDEDLSQIPFKEIAGRYLVAEEKIDGANTGISFDKEGNLLLQSRGHYLTGGYRERHYALLKQWATVWSKRLYEVLGSRYIMYGEWVYAKHTVFYDMLPHYFMEFDIYDKENDIFLDTPSRQRLTSRLPVSSVPVLKEGVFKDQKELTSLLGASKYISDNHIERLREYALKNGLDADRQCRETDLSNTMEGIYIKVEEEGKVTFRAKYVRASFLQTVELSETHWLDRPIVPNQLSVPFDTLFEDERNSDMH